jgi:hypothetical protein
MENQNEVDPNLLNEAKAEYDANRSKLRDQLQKYSCREIRLLSLSRESDYITGGRYVRGMIAFADPANPKDYLFGTDIDFSTKDGKLWLNVGTRGDFCRDSDDFSKYLLAVRLLSNDKDVVKFIDENLSFDKQSAYLKAESDLRAKQEQERLDMRKKADDVILQKSEHVDFGDEYPAFMSYEHPISMGITNVTDKNVCVLMTGQQNCRWRRRIEKRRFIDCMRTYFNSVAAKEETK